MRIAIFGAAKQTNKVTGEKWKSAARRKKRGKGGGGGKRESEDINKNPEGRRVKEMESVKKERKSAAAV